MGLPDAETGGPGGGGMGLPDEDVGGRWPPAGGALGRPGGGAAGRGGRGVRAAGAAGVDGWGLGADGRGAAGRAAGRGGAGAGAGAGAAAAGPGAAAAGRAGARPGSGRRGGPSPPDDVTRGRGGGGGGGVLGVGRAGACDRPPPERSGALLDAARAGGRLAGASSASAGAGAAAAGASARSSRAGALAGASSFAGAALGALAALAGASDAFSVFALGALVAFAAFTGAGGSSGCWARTSPSRSARRRTRSACASSIPEECVLTPMPKAKLRSRHSLFVSPSSRASSWTRIFAAKFFSTSPSWCCWARSTHTRAQIAVVYPRADGTTGTNTESHHGSRTPVTAADGPPTKRSGEGVAPASPGPAGLQRCLAQPGAAPGHCTALDDGSVGIEREPHQLRLGTTCPAADAAPDRHAL
jgi:hypothetical protein